jgi:O-Antigen ligase
MKGLIFTYTLTFGGAVVSLFRPFIGLLIYVCFVIISPEELWSHSVPRFNYIRVVAVSLLIGWALQGFGDWRFGRAGGTVVGLLGFLLVWVVEAIIAPNKELAWQGIEPFLTVVVPFMAGITLVDSVAKLKHLVWVIVLSQGYLAYEFNMRYRAGNFIPEDFSFRGLDNNGIGIMMVSSIGPAFFLGLQAPKWWARAAALVAAVLMMHVVLFSMSRGGMLGLLVTTAVGFLLIPKRPKHYVALLLGVLLVLRLAGTGVREEFGSSFAGEEERDASAALRTKHWRACTESMLRHPFGVGPNHWPLVAPEYGLPAMEAHSTWFQIGAEFGLPGLFCIMFFYGSCLVRLWPLSRESTPVLDPWMRHLARMVIASLVGFIISAQFVTCTKGVELPYYITLIGAGVLKLAASPARDNTRL